MAVTVGELVGWYENADSPEKRVCVLRTSRWAFPGDVKVNAEDEKDLFSIWIPSIIEITEYTEKRSPRKK